MRSLKQQLVTSRTVWNEEHQVNIEDLYEFPEKHMLLAQIAAKDQGMRAGPATPSRVIRYAAGVDGADEHGPE